MSHVTTCEMTAPDAQPADRSGERDGGDRGESPDAPSLTRSDERLLAYLDDVGTDYPAFVASNTGLYADHVAGGARGRGARRAGDRGGRLPPHRRGAVGAPRRLSALVGLKE